MTITLNGTTGVTTTGLTSNGIDDNATSTAMTLDASGNLLVGKTTSSLATAGTALRGDNPGLINSARAGTILELNRLTTDGSIVDLYKDGVTVGSIGANGTKMYTGSGATGLHFNRDDASIEPYNPLTISTRDAAIDLGSPDERFKDLYLSGGVFLGGTGAANKLDDYEEGTWTPVFSDAAGSGNAATANGGKRGFYTKIGNTVHVYCIGSNLVTTGMTGANDLYIQGLPFTPTSFVSPNQSFVGTARLSDIAFTGYVVSQVTDATTYLRLNEVRSGLGIDSIIVSQLTSAAADVIISMTYQTNS